jgi:CSLREA domain-containing protein
MVPSSHPFVLALLIGALVVLAVPALAAGADFTVNGTGDTSTQGACESHAGECTLRGAILAANGTSAKDRILFSGVFNGNIANSTITTEAELPVLTEPVEIAGGSCSTTAGVSGPCVEVKVPSNRLAFNVEANETTIGGLAIGGGFEGIVLTESSSGFVAQNDWLGVALDGTTIGGTQAGIRVNEGSVDTTIGGTEPSQRNLFANYGTGLDIGGATEVTVQGNWFGVEPDGTPAPTQAGFDISVHNVGATPVSKVQIGAPIEGAALTTKACDGGCNVIAHASTGIALASGGAATGPVTIHGNYIGLGPDGSTVIPNTNWGVNVGAAGKVTVGGPGGEKNANFFAGGSIGVAQGGGGGFDLVGNRFGIGPVDGAATAAVTSAVSVGGPVGDAEPPLVAENQIRAEGGQQINSIGPGSVIRDNVVTGAQTGIHIGGSTGGHGNLIEGNTIRTSGFNSLVIENGPNEVVGNKIEGAGFSTVFLSGAADGNKIGGDTPASENLISGSTQTAIALVLPESTHNEVARNRGEDNNGFISLGRANGAEPNLPNGGISPPVVTSAMQSSVSGTAKSGAKVRVFIAGVGGLKSFLGEVIAEGGNWKVPLPTVPIGTPITATQTLDGGTSELSESFAAAADPPPNNGGGENGGGGSSSGGGTSQSSTPTPTPTPTSSTTPTRPTAPVTRITKGPAKSSKARTARFRFTAIPAVGARFECKLDNAKWARCASPRTYKKMRPGKHTFQVRATANGLIGSGAKFKFTVRA